MAIAVDRLLAVDPVDDDVFVATISPRRRLPRLFGGQVAAQALLAASRTVSEDRPPHSLHGYFVRAGKPDLELTYVIARIRDGRSFSTRHVSALQDDTVIFQMLASFQHPEPGADWQAPTPPISEVPRPPEGPGHPRLAHLAGHLEVRPVNDPGPDTWKLHPFWFRTSPPIGADQVLNTAMLTYVSDIALMANARAPGTNEPMAVAASIDHALWFHRLPRVDDWLLFSTEPFVNIGTRGVVRGTFHTREGALVASVVQEALLRPALR